MKLRRKHKEGAELFTEALNDIMFFLLLFFLIIATMAKERSSINVNLPNSNSKERISHDLVDLTITKDRRYYINNVEVSFDILEPTLKAEAEAKKSEFIRLRLDQELTVQDLADVLQIGTKLKLKMVIVTQSVK